MLSAWTGWTGKTTATGGPNRSRAPTAVDRAWWKEAVCYQIYPRSFDDTDGDGVGDLPGVIERLDYLEELGVDVVWLNPVYESPNVDNGYDIADYRAIDDEFGTMADWEALRDGLHDRGIRLIMDLVVNHTSDEHDWFQRSLDPDSDYRDWYVWREGRPIDDPDVPAAHRDRAYTGVPDGVDEAPPNDWESFFGGPAWTYHEPSGEWYLHLFDEKQPDLNWEHPPVREAIFEMMRWWLEQGIDGFRMDVINLLSKPEGLPDGDDPGAIVRGADRFVNGPRIHDYVGAMYDEVLAGTDAMTVGEMVDLTVAEAREYLAPEGDGMSMAFNFDHMWLDFDEADGRWSDGEWTLPELKATISHWQYGLAERGWNSLYLNNHDQPRQVSRFGDDEEVLELVRRRSRDNARTPMQWTDGKNAGFTEGEPWLPVNPNHVEINVEAARAAPDSVFHYYRRLLRTRREHDVLLYGAYDLLVPDHEAPWVYTRTLSPGDLGRTTRERALVVLNVSTTPTRFDPPESIRGAGCEVLLANYDVAGADAVDRIEPFDARPYEARVYGLSK
jgi:oligo-1,6-glucosidase